MAESCYNCTPTDFRLVGIGEGKFEITVKNRGPLIIDSDGDWTEERFDEWEEQRFFELEQVPEDEVIGFPLFNENFYYNAKVTPSDGVNFVNAVFVDNYNYRRTGPVNRVSFRKQDNGKYHIYCGHWRIYVNADNSFDASNSSGENERSEFTIQPLMVDGRAMEGIFSVQDYLGRQLIFQNGRMSVLPIEYVDPVSVFRFEKSGTK